MTWPERTAAPGPAWRRPRAGCGAERAVPVQAIPPRHRISRKMCWRARSMVRLLNSRTAVLRKRMGGSRTGCQSPIWRRVRGPCECRPGARKTAPPTRRRTSCRRPGRRRQRPAYDAEPRGAPAAVFSIRRRPAASAAGGSAVNGRFAAGSWRFRSYLRRNGRKDGRHQDPHEDEVTLTFAWTHRKIREGMAREKLLASHHRKPVCRLTEAKSCLSLSRPKRIRARSRDVVRIWFCSSRARGSYQPRVCSSCDSSMAAAARPFMVPVTCSLTSARILGSL